MTEVATAPAPETMEPSARAVARNTNAAFTSAGGGIVFKTVAEARDVAYLMAGSDKAVRKHLRNNPGACFGIVIQAVEWGFSPYAVANKSYEVNDQLAYESQLIQAVILRRAPIRGRIKFDFEGKDGDRICVASATDLVGDVVEYRSPKLKDIKPQNSPLWKMDPDQQLTYFSGRSLCRRHFPDVLMGIYDVDEIEGAQGLKDVTPQPSGLASRLNGGLGGFDPDRVTSTLEQAQGSQDAPAAATGAQTDEAPPAPVSEPLTGIGDTEVERAGAQAFVDGKPREVPDDLFPGDQADWLNGYDLAAKAKKAGL